MTGVRRRFHGAHSTHSSGACTRLVHPRLLQRHAKLEAFVRKELGIGEPTGHSVRVLPHCLSVEGATPGIQFSTIIQFTLDSRRFVAGYVK